MKFLEIKWNILQSLDSHSSQLITKFLNLESYRYDFKFGKYTIYAYYDLISE